MTTALSPRETEIMRLIAAGWLSKEIAAQRGISVRTVETHRERARLKHEAGIREHRKPGEGFVGDPVIEGYAELIDLLNYLSEAIACGERVAAGWYRVAADLTAEVQTHLQRTRPNGPPPPPAPHP